MTTTTFNKRLQRGMNYTVTEILQIISSCRQFGVQRLKVYDVEVDFFPERQKDAVADIKSPVDDKLMDDVRLSQLMIDDPYGFEREMISIEQRRMMDEAVQN